MSIMQSRLAAAVIFGLATVALPFSAHAADFSAQKAQILAIEKAMTAAQSMAELAPYIDQNIVFDDFTPGRVTGVKAFTSDVAAQFAAAKNLHVAILRMDVDADERLAYAYSIQHLVVTTAANQTVAMTFRQTDCYHHVDGKWLMVAQQISVPYDPKTGKAVFDAAP